MNENNLAEGNMNSIFNQLRTHNGSQESAFERLCCQLAQQNKPSRAHRFIPVAPPDAGVECYWMLEDGSEWGWQAKYFTSSLGNSQWQQLDHSVKTALQKHPRLVKYIVCLPIDFSDGRRDGQTSGLEKWNQHCDKWSTWANDEGRCIEFTCWGKHELESRLSTNENRGRHWYWFHTQQFTPKWFCERAQRASAQVSTRYHPDLDVQLDVYKSLRVMNRDAKTIHDELDLVPLVRDLHKQVKQNDYLNRKIGHIDSYRDFLLKHYSPEALVTAILVDWDELRTRTLEIQRLLEHHRKVFEQNHVIPKDKQKYHEYTWTEPIATTDEILETIDSNLANLLNKRVLVLRGDAGQGKTHMLCSLAQELSQNGKPVVLVIGSHLDAKRSWEEILSRSALDFAGSKEEFLGALSACAEAENARALILIDALNESINAEDWPFQLPAILHDIKQYPNIDLVVSVRSSKVGVVLPEDWRSQNGNSEIAYVTHRGFFGNSYKAINHIFSSMGVPLPLTPLLHPELTNPLFVILLAKELKAKANSSNISRAFGFDEIHSYLIAEINRKLSVSNRLDYDPDDQIVQRSLRQIAMKMLEQQENRLPKRVAKRICDNIHPSSKHSTSLLNNLIHENLLSAFKSETGTVYISFEFERMVHHWQAEAIIAKYQSVESLRSSLAIPAELGQYIGTPHQVSYHSGLLEALLMLVPSRLGSEMIDLLPNCTTDEHEYARNQLLNLWMKTLKWRQPKSMKKDDVIRIINGSGLMLHRFSSFWDTIITVAPIPNHPLNAKYLHINLHNMKMPDRDQLWSIALHNNFQYQVPNNEEPSAANLILDWVEQVLETCKTYPRILLPKEVVELTGIALAWFLTSPNRGLRDRTTKVLVRLYRSRLDELPMLLDCFMNVDDIYVVERVLAVAYGCVLFSENTAQIQHIANKIVHDVFEAGKVPLHLLARDYACGIVEYAIHKGCELEIDRNFVSPPFGAEYEEEKLSEDEIDRLYEEACKGGNTCYKVDARWYSDFYRYILGSNSGSFPWYNRKLSEPVYVPQSERISIFSEVLTEKQAHKFNELQIQIGLNRRDFFVASLIGKTDDSNKVQSSVSEDVNESEKLTPAVSLALSTFSRSLGKNKRLMFQEEIEPLLLGLSDEPTFNLSKAERWIAHRILTLGWTKPRFEEYDSLVDHHYGMRSNHRVERIFKKYQWIAYWEFLARVADNFQFIDGRSMDDKVKPYNGTWQIGFERDIDPTLLIERTQSDSSTMPAWWAPSEFRIPSDLRYVENAALGMATLRRWVKDHEAFPDANQFITVTHPETQEHWIALCGSYRWELPLPRVGTYGNVTVFINIESFLVKRQDAQAAKKLLMDKQIEGGPDGLPGSIQLYDVFMGELFWSPAYKDCTEIDDSTDWRPIDYTDENSLRVIPASSQYTAESGRYDHSISKAIHLQLPCRWLATQLGLQWSSQGLSFKDESGKTVMIDPSVGQQGPSVLLIREDTIENVLKEHDLVLVHAIWGHKYPLLENGRAKDDAGELYYCAATSSCQIEPEFLDIRFDCR